jgi:hypothetical protein
VDELSLWHGKLYFQYGQRKKGLRGPRCLALRHGDDIWSFAQKQTDGCMSADTPEEYAKAVVGYFGCLDEGEQNEIKDEVRHDLGRG